MSESLPITTPPRRRADFTAFTNLFSNIQNSESCKNTPNVTRKLESHHQVYFESGSQSAKSSPLPQRRLDKLEGVIRDIKPSPLVHKKFDTIAHHFTGRRNTDSGNSGYSQTKHDNLSSNLDSPLLIRRRLESDCSCNGSTGSGRLKNKYQNGCEHQQKSVNDGGDHESSPLLKRRDLFGSPARNTSSNGQHSSGFIGSPAKQRVVCDLGTFPSPIRSRCESPCDENLKAESPQQPDQTIVSGWLKFRDNKRVSLKFILFFVH